MSGVLSVGRLQALLNEKLAAGEITPGAIVALYVDEQGLYPVAEACVPQIAIDYGERVEIRPEMARFVLLRAATGMKSPPVNFVPGDE
jgi:hypothetical protein